MPPLLVVNDIPLTAIMAAGEEPKVKPRDIGNKATASDGTMRVSRQTRKIDLAFKSIPLSLTDAFSWQSFLIGEGEVWSFNSTTPGFYGCKGTGPSSSSGCTIEVATPKFGNARLRMVTTGSIVYSGVAANLFGYSTDWTVMVWRSTNGSTWTHYIVRSDGAKWVDGVQNNAASTTWLSVSSGDVTIANSEGATRYYDDLVVFPFKILGAWGPYLGAATSAYPLLPANSLKGSLVPEQTERSVLGEVESTVFRVAATTMSRLEVELKAK